MKRRIYRIENDQRHGPFTVLGTNQMTPPDRLDEYVGYISSRQFEPHMFLETRFNVKIPFTHHYGCPSLECLMDWFPVYTHEYLEMHGFYVMVYEVEESDILIETENQVAFDLLESEAVDILTVKEAYNRHLDECLGLAA